MGLRLRKEESSCSSLGRDEGVTSPGAGVSVPIRDKIRLGSKVMEADGDHGSSGRS